MLRNQPLNGLLVSTLLMTLPAMAEDPSHVSAPPQLTQVATFEHQVTGVTVSKHGRIFVNFPRWTDDAPISVAEVAADGALKPYPDSEWNAWRNTRKNELPADKHFVCVQSVVVDAQNALWVVDAAAPATGFIVPNGPKLVKIDLTSNQVVLTIPFDKTAAPQGTYLNDVRFSPDGKFAYLTDSGAQGALIVVDLQAGKPRRVLDGHPTTQVEKDVVVKTDGKELRRPDGRTAEFAADGIALSSDGQTLYWQALTGKTLYKIPTAALQDASLSTHDLESKIEKAGENGVADGLWIDTQNRMFVTSPQDNSIKMREHGADLKIVIEDDRLRWPDTFGQGPDGSLYFTTSRIQDMNDYKPQNPPALPTQLWKIAPLK